jgi:Tol biopolymer transport system component
MNWTRWCLSLSLALATALAACSRGGSSSASNTAAQFATASAASEPASVNGPIVLVRDQRLLIRARDGTERLLLRTPPNTFPSFPVWSPDGTRVAYVQATLFTGQPGADWGSDIYVAEVSSGEPRLVWKHAQAGEQVQGLAWTPDGKALLLGYLHTRIEGGKYLGQTQRIERLEIEGGRRSVLVEGGTFPSLTRDGARMAYLTQDASGQGALWVAGADGSGAVALVSLGPEMPAILGPRVAPDGSAVAFAAPSPRAAVPRPSSAAKAGLHAAHGLPMEVWRVDVASRALTRLTNFKEDEPYPAWTSDGTMLIALGAGGLYEIRPDGSQVRRIGEGSFGGQADVR